MNFKITGIFLPKAVAFVCLILLFSFSSSLIFAAGDIFMVGSDNNYPPYEFSEKDLARGFNVDIVKAVARRMDIHIQFNPRPWSEIRSLLKKQRRNMITCLYRFPSREKDFIFTQPFLVVFHSIFVRKSDTGIHGIGDLENKFVAVQKGDIMDDYARRFLGNARILRVENQLKAMQILDSGKADAALIGHLTGLYFIKRKFVSGVAATGKPFAPQRYCMAVSKKEPYLLNQLDEGLRIVRHEGEYNEIYDKWFGGLIENPRYRRNLKLARLMILILMVLITFWIGATLILKVQVRRRTASLNRELKERKKAEQRFREIFDLNLAGMGILSGDMHWKMVNSRISELLGYSENQLVGSSIFKYIYSADRQILDAELGKVREFRNNAVLLDCRFLNVRNEIVYCLFSVRQGGSRSEFIAGLLDVTDRRILSEKLHASQKMQALGTLAGGIAHDFNNLLGVILGSLEMSGEDLRTGNFKNMEGCLKNAQKAVFRARDLVKQILAFSSREIKQRTVLDLSEQLREVVNLMKATIPASVSVSDRIEGKGFNVCADEVQLQQVLINLISNSVYALRNNGGHVWLHLSRRELNRQKAAEQNLSAGDYIKLEVKDDGEGISCEIMPRIFEPYFTTRRNSGGSGMGLAVVHGIVAGLNGSVKVESESGLGTTVTVWLPETGEHAETEEQDSEPETRGEGQSVFVLDDEPQLVEITARILDSLGYRTTTFTDSVAAFQQISADPNAMDLLITDQTMPGLTGMEMIRKIRAEGNMTPIILCSGFSESIDFDQIEQLGNIRVLLKPFRRGEIAVIIRDILEAD